MRNNAPLILVVLAVCGCDAQKVSVDQICKDEQVRGSVVVDGYLRAGSSLRCGRECVMWLVAATDAERGVNALVQRGNHRNSVSLLGEDGTEAPGALFSSARIITNDDRSVDTSTKLRLEGKVFTDGDGCKIRVTSIDLAP